MPSFGEKLKREREKRSVTLEQISLSTKIGTRMLQALEENRFSQLPGGIFNKGFVRAYARYVGLDEDQAVADYLEASGEGVPAPADTPIEPLPTRFESRSTTDSKPLPWGLFAALLLLVALVLSLWSRRQHTPARPPAAVPATEKSAPVSTPPQSQPPTLSSGTGPKAEPPRPTKPEISAGTSPQSASSNAKVPAQPATATPSAPQPGEFTVMVLARQDSWLNITADGKTAFSDTLLAGNQRAVHARSQVMVRSGNTGGLDFVFNGKKLPPQGNYGEVKTLTFGSDGLQTNVPPPPVVQ